ncbi:MAG: hypothetical protein COW03_04495 [Cytophagales bacterium CG12_big_fil_rev_8_21_14_0_65_40_12]|nr:MAG: hypothetical protein COW03_04495 [Cytophagales bacterium CG12_big_fil_rev_8_21_14_0_65_40_12]PIW05853.1 MAG: hypothetical protein COW40_02900 [Cytophagales bacterium CG17_big_fil_post_rev_8_21_14_2_50_40_13]
MAGSSYILAPIDPKSRVISLDILRGVAVLGILAMTIQSYSMPWVAYSNPTAFENLEDINFYVWLLSHVFANEKFMAIFSMLFGATIILISQKARKEHLRSGDLQYRRFFWLFIIGVFHAYLLWAGDILVIYAICGFFMFAFRSKKKEYLFRAGLIFLLIGSLLKFIFAYSIPLWEPGQFEAFKAEVWAPDSQAIAEEIDYYTSSWERQMLIRTPQAFKMQTKVFISETFWRVCGLILLGMGLYKKGVLTAKQSTKFLAKLAIYGISIGLPLVLVGVILDFNDRWDFEKSYFYYAQFNYWGSVAMALGYIGIIVLLCKAGTKNFMAKRMAAVGQMAMTNYIMQSIICTYAFYGHGLALFGDLDRAAQAVFVFAIWVFQVVFSSLWLSYFQYGPLEWFWRSLSYGKIQKVAKA